MTFEALCTKTLYAYHNKSSLIKPSFIEGKTYTFQEKETRSKNDEELIVAINENGMESVLTIAHFEKHFQRV